MCEFPPPSQGLQKHAAAAELGAKGWQDKFAVYAKGVPGAAPIAAKHKVPKNWTIARPREFLPPVKGCTCWHALATDRARVSYIVAKRRRAASASTPRFGVHKAVKFCIEWAWKRHRACGHIGPAPLPDL